jgi:hypothetical protein
MDRRASQDTPTLMWQPPWACGGGLFKLDKNPGSYVNGCRPILGFGSLAWNPINLPIFDAAALYALRPRPPVINIALIEEAVGCCCVGGIKRAREEEEDELPPLGAKRPKL